MKDYYAILGLSASSPALEIKKAYRKLAFQYHPDTNRDNSFAASHFKEINEAYAVLSNAAKRKRYDEERWLSGMGTRMKERQAITPSWILHECTKLNKHMETIDSYRMNHDALNEYIFMILSDSHMAVLQQHADTEKNKLIVKEILKAIKRIRYPYSVAICEQLEELAGNEKETLSNIYTYLGSRKLQQKKDKYLPLLALVIVLIICLLMYNFGRK